MTTVEILRGAKAELQRRGWHQGYFLPEAANEAPAGSAERRNCPVCLMGALNCAAGWEPDEDRDGGLTTSEAENILLDLLGYPKDSTGEIAKWNDTDGRTVDEVHALLDRAIGLVEGKVQP